MPKKSTKKRTPVVATTDQVCALLEINASTLTRWKTKYGIDEMMVSRGVWDLRAVMYWWAENIFTGGGEEEDASLAVEKLRWQKAHSDREEFKRDVDRRQLVPREKIVKDLCRRWSLVAKGLEIYEDRLPPVLEGKGRDEMREIIHQENEQLRAAFAGDGKYPN